ncbi:MAG: phosphatidylserine decarboxylase [Verrucomicrobia bacterium]|nr:phosphatidylserine decarboxylase [Verrucomicrobiota bacterium]
MKAVEYINRKTGLKEPEEVFGESAIRFLYGDSLLSKTIGRLFLHSLAKWPPISRLYGVIQSSPSSKARVQPFIDRFRIDTSEFLEPADSFKTFNDFFIRKLKPGARPLAQGPIIPADGRYRFYQEIALEDTFEVKKRSFNLETVLQSKELARRYQGGSLVIARLCPTDCHRFYFPFDCIPSKALPINGKLFSVNPIATKDNPWIWGANRRMLTMLQSEQFGEVAFLEVGATNVGSIIQTYTPGKAQPKGAEKGYFEFGGSALLIIFEKGRIQFDEDLLKATAQDIEMRCLIGESLGQPLT